MRRVVIAGLLLGALSVAGCGVTGEDEPEPLPISPSTPLPTITRRTEPPMICISSTTTPATVTTKSSDSRQVKPACPESG